MIKVDEDWGHYIAEEFNGYLNSIKKDECFNPGDPDFPDFRPTYIMGPEPLNQEEEKKWPGCEVICFRAVGYTIGHTLLWKKQNLITILLEKLSIMPFQV